MSAFAMAMLSERLRPTRAVAGRSAYPSQLEALRAFMSDHRYHSLAEMAEFVECGEATVSAAIRALRHHENGGHVIEKTRREGVWLYRDVPKLGGAA